MDPNLKDKIEQNKDQLLDLATGTLCTKTISDLEKPGARNVIRAELLEVFNNALGGPLIKEIYITELAVQ
jgi:flagellar basal body-associated protein FliL